MQRFVKILVLGAGSVGLRHLRNLFKLGYGNVAVSDSDNSRLNSTMIPGHVRRYQNAGRALKKEDPDVVFVCTPTPLHLAHATAAVRAGADVFIEKPLSHSLRDIQVLLREVKRHKRIVMVGCNYRFHRGWQVLWRVLQSGNYGKPLCARIAVGYYLPSARKGRDYRKIYAAQRLGGGVILDSGSHVADYIPPLMGKIKKSAAVIAGTNSLGIAGEEEAHILFLHEGGAVSAVSLDYVSRRPVHRIEIITDRGRLVLDLVREVLSFEYGNGSRILFKGTKDEDNRSFVGELRHFFLCVRKRRKPLQDLSDAQETLKLLLKIKQRAL